VLLAALDAHPRAQCAPRRALTRTRARRFITPVERLRVANPDIRADGMLEVGQEICVIPGVCAQPS
jgi:hypothetical protein